MTTQRPQRVGLPYLGYHLPAAAMTIEEFVRRRGLAQGMIRQFRDAGLERVYVSEDESCVDLAHNAAAQVLSAARIDPHTIDCLIFYHTSYLTALEPRTVAVELCDRLRLKRAIGFAVAGQHCASVLGAIRIARNMILCGSAARILVVGADWFAGSLRREILGTTILQGEAACCVLVEANALRNEVLVVANRMHGQFYRGVSVTEKEAKKFNVSYYLGAKRVVTDALQNSNLRMENIDLIIPHNVSRTSWERLMSILGCQCDKLYADNIVRHGHLCGSDLIVNLADASQEGRVRQGNHVLLLTVGLGASWAAALLRH